MLTSERTKALKAGRTRCAELILEELARAGGKLTTDDVGLIRRIQARHPDERRPSVAALWQSLRYLRLRREIKFRTCFEQLIISAAQNGTDGNATDSTKAKGD